VSVYLVSRATNFFFDTQDVANNAKIVTGIINDFILYFV